MLRLGALVVVIAFAGRALNAQAAPGDLSGSLPRNGIGLAVWGGGSVESLAAVAAARECGVAAVWLASPTTPSEFIGFVRGAPALVSAPFATAFPTGPPANGAVIVVCSDAAPPAATQPTGTATPNPSATATPTASPTAKLIPDEKIGVYGLQLSPSSTTQFKSGITYLDTTPAARGNPNAVIRVTYVRVCRWDSKVPTRAEMITTTPLSCSSETAPDTNKNFDPKTWLFDLPSPGQTIAVTMQLCNIDGCSDLFYSMGVVTRGASFYVTGETLVSGSRVVAFPLMPTVRYISGTYSDGLSWKSACTPPFTCDHTAIITATGGHSGQGVDGTTAKSVTVTSFTLENAQIESFTVQLRQ